MDQCLPDSDAGASRRTFLRSAVIALAALIGCGGSPAQPLAFDGPRLRARPRAPTRHLDPGDHDLLSAAGVQGSLYVPTGYRAEPVALFVMLHGAGPSRDQIHRFFPYADPHGIAVLAPKSVDRTWDMIVGAFGPDVAALNTALEYTFANCAIDGTRITLGGFSDGGSYALSLGLANGDLFSRLVGFSPGFLGRIDRVGRPAIFLAHGTNDVILPIESTSRVIHDQLRTWGYDVTYREFDGPHTVPTAILEEAFAWMKAPLP